MEGARGIEKNRQEVLGERKIHDERGRERWLHAFN